MVSNAAQSGKNDPSSNSSKESVFVVEDNPELQQSLSQLLKKAGYSVLCFSSAEDLIESLTESPGLKPAAVLIDFHLAGKMTGGELTQYLRDRPESSDLAIIMLTAKSDTPSIVQGLKGGADDYITKPFESDLLMARLEACIRRTKSHPGPIKVAREKLSQSGIEIDTVSHEVHCDGKPIALTAFEFQLLHILMSHPNEVLSREDILVRIVGAKHLVTERTIDVHIRALRAKLGDKAKAIETVRGFGYKFTASSHGASGF